MAETENNGKNGCSEDQLSARWIPRIACSWQNPRRHVPAKDRATEEREDASLLERGREPAARQWTSGAASRALPRRDQFLASRSLAQGDRGVRRGRGTVARALAVPR